MKLLSGLSGHVARDHMFIGGIAAAAVGWKWGGGAAMIFWTANILIDMDHFIHYAFATRFRGWSVPGMFRFHQALFDQRDRPDFLALEIFHTAECLFLVGFASLRSPFVRFIFFGALFHVAVDVVHLSRHRILAKRSHSFLEFLIRLRSLRRRGLSPAWMYRL